MTRTHRIRTAAIVAALALSIGALAGCSLIPNPVRDIAEQAEKANPLGSLPADWPAEVPVVDGDVVVGVKSTETAWGATIKVADASGLDEAASLLEGAGFSEAIADTYSYEGEAYFVQLAGSELDDDGYGIVYLVTAK
ncbi:MAG: hypothetical protein QM598_00520 [Protaetiibacter sp.]